MNIILLNKQEVTNDGIAVLKDYRAKHIVKVLKSEQGDTLRVGIIQGKIGEGIIVRIKKKFPFLVELNVTYTLKPPVKSPVDLVLALPRPIMLKRILSQGTALGIGTFHIINAARVEKSFWEAGLMDEDHYMGHLLHGLEQAIDTVPPQVVFHRRFKPFIEDFLPGISGQYSKRVFAHPGSPKSLKDILVKGQGKILLAIGPEGGWVEYEEKLFSDHSFLGFTIGKRILKVDTAVVNIHGRIMEEIE